MSEAAEYTAFNSDDVDYYRSKTINKGKMKSKITAVEKEKEYEGKYGKMYVYKYTFEDGTEGQANHKTDSPKHQKGSEVDYEAKSDEYGTKITFPQASPFTPKSYGRSPEEQLIIARQSSLKIAVDYFSMNGFKEDPEYPKTSQMIDVAEIFTDYAINGKK